MKLYTREIGGIEHTFQLDDDEAAKLKKDGAELTEVKAAAPQNKAARPANK